jgi:hypothetical protein
MPRLDVAHCREQCDGARGAGRLVAGCRHAGQLGVDVGEEAAEDALAAEQVGNEIAHVADL